ncbi:HNH endonuclease signature motif containing protein [Pseudomonas monteilii]|uniref:HNH endonuclease signature motif containing protein n=1 Tax=Pseudomonas monteilii TaxID=76759 RepID=UPI0018AA604A|nr:HNH endonuclease signature motif containing protein [Pseudomonas monteilii]MBF8746854.1 HNH endonuclease [Pseudomonas monteilii]
MIDQQYLSARLFYCAHIGSFTWLPRPLCDFVSEERMKAWNTRYAGSRAGKVNSNGYLLIQINGKHYRAHRLAWLASYGKWPTQHIDHINGNKLDNRIINLRDVSSLENNRNMPLLASNKSGRVGVSWYSARSEWVAHIKVDGRQKILGRFKSKDLAIAAREAAERELGFHPNHGRLPTA